MIRVERISGLDVKLGGEPWDFATVERARIDAYWQRVVRDRPFLWNGQILMCTRAEAGNGLLSARFALTDYASFVAWRDWGWPDREVRSCFAVPAVISADGALLMGVMGKQTLNVGKSYPPSGSLEPRDVQGDGTIDLRASMVTELREETGLDLDQAEAGETIAIFEGQRLAVVQRHDHPLTFPEMEQVFLRHKALAEEQELSHVTAIHHSSQIDSRMPVYAQEIIRQFLT